MKDETITLSTGVVLRVKRISPMVVQAIRSDLARTRPKVPIVHIKEDDRDEANPMDPEYIEAKSVWESQLTDAIYDALIVQGTEAVTPLPDGIPSVESMDWQEDLLVSHIEVPTEGKGWRKARYLAWVRYVAAKTPEDIQVIILAGNRAAGLAEVDVAKAADSFSDSKGRPANTGGLGTT